MHIEGINDNWRSFFFIPPDFDVWSAKINQLEKGQIRDVIPSEQSEMSLNNDAIFSESHTPRKTVKSIIIFLSL